MKAQELKSSILKYAIEGKLVPQARDDEPASILMEKINTERQNLITEKILKREKNLPPLSNNEIPFEIPSSWVWVRLGDISNIGSFKSVTKDLINDNDWVLDLEDIESNSGVLLKKTAKNQKSVNSNKYTFKKNNVMYGKLRPYLNKVIIAEDSGYCTTEILPLDFGSFIYNKYAKYVLMSPFFLNYVNRCSYGVKMPRLGSNDSKVAPFPLPPFEEQKRIVKKIEELFQKVNQYDYLEQKLTVLNDNFPNNMERSVLQYAVQGKLVPQIDAEESSKVLLNDIKKLNKNFAKYDQISKEDNVPFEIPSTWSWVKLGQLGVTQTGTTPKKSNPENFNGNIPFIKPADITGKSINYDNECLTEVGLRNGRKVDEYSILMVCIGSIGKCYYTDKVVSCDQQINALTPYVSDVKFLYYMLSAPFFQQQAWKNSSSTTLPILNKTKWSNLLIPLAPLDEQRRIVEKIEEIFNSNQKLNMLIK